MPKARVYYGLFACGVLWITGCTMLPGMLGSSATSGVTAQPAAPANTGHPAEPTTPPGPPAVQSGPPSPAPRVDPREVDALVAEIARKGVLEPAALEELAQNLHQTDPSVWPATRRMFEAFLVYDRQLEQRAAVAARRALEASRQAPQEPPIAPPSHDERVALSAPAVPVETAAFREPEPVRPSRSARAERTPTEQSPATRPQADARKPEREKPAEPARAKPQSSDEQKGERATASAASSSSSVSENWRDRLTATINALEAEARQMPKTPAEVDIQARLRLLYLLAERREDALKPIASAPTATQEFWSQELYGLATWMDSERTTDASRRAGEARLHLASALNRLGDLAPLMLRNLSFVYEISSFGDFKPFDRCEFTPGQEVGLYAEVENFKSEETPKGYFTSLRGKYEVFDSRGESVHKQDLSTTEEHCRNPRRDFFLGYRLHLPKSLHPGRYRLQLTVEDVKKQQVAQSSIDFTIKAGSEGTK